MLSKKEVSPMKQPFIVKALYIAFPVAVMTATVAIFRFVLVLVR